jgi:hypothetical protein
LVNTILRLLLLLVVGCLLLLGYWRFFPSQETRIRRMLGDLARVVSTSPNSSPLANLAAANQLAGFFTKDVEINVDVPTLGRHTFSGREEIIQAAAAARSNSRGVKIEFLDILVRLQADKQSAVADLTAKVTRAGERDFDVQELKFRARKVDGGWRIARVDTVRTLGL